MRKTIIFIFLCLSFLVNYNEAVSSGTSVPTLGTFGYMAAVLCPTIMCSGCMITPKVAVTTAACVNTLTADQVMLNLGSTQYYTGGMQASVGTLLKHPTYTASTYDYNIALLGLTVALTSAQMSQYSITPIPIASALVPTNSLAVVSAYGTTDPNLTIPPYMMKASLTVYTLSACQTYKSNRLTSNMFCAGDPNGAKDLCPVDQGAPFVYNGALVGIYNWGCSCGLSSPNPSSPVFTSCVNLKNWITTNSATM